MKRKKFKNPVYREAFERGFDEGVEIAQRESSMLFSQFLKERFESLTDVPGIGEKTKIKLHNHFMEELPNEKKNI